MPAPITSERGRIEACTRCGVKTFYVALLFFSLHWAIVTYLNSSYLEQYFSTQTTSALYILGSLMTLIAFLSASRIFGSVGNIRLTFSLALIEIALLLGLAFISIPAVVAVLFVLHHAIVPFILLTLDTLIEGLVGTDESATGGHRGLFLTIGGLTYALATLSMGFLLGGGEPQFGHAYLASAALLIPFLLILQRNFRAYPDPAYPTTSPLASIQQFWNQPDIRYVFFSYFLLQFFFSWMVIYTPMYLTMVIGYNWEQVGVILFIALLAYVFFEYPVGYLADKYFGEKEMMVLGFVAIATSVAYCALLDGSSILTWIAVMFMTRVGASLVEVTSESYFFKHTQGRDTDRVSIFRIAQPLGYIIGAISIGVLTFYFSPSGVFVVLGFLMLPGILCATAIRDTR